MQLCVLVLIFLSVGVAGQRVPANPTAGLPVEFKLEAGVEGVLDVHELWTFAKIHQKGIRIEVNSSKPVTFDVRKCGILVLGVRKLFVKKTYYFQSELLDFLMEKSKPTCGKEFMEQENQFSVVVHQKEGDSGAKVDMKFFIADALPNVHLDKFNKMSVVKLETGDMAQTEAMELGYAIRSAWKNPEKYSMNITVDSSQDIHLMYEKCSIFTDYIYTFAYRSDSMMSKELLWQLNLLSQLRCKDENDLSTINVAITSYSPSNGTVTFKMNTLVPETIAIPTWEITIGAIIILIVISIIVGSIFAYKLGFYKCYRMFWKDYNEPQVIFLNQNWAYESFINE